MLLEQFDLLRDQNAQKRLGATIRIFEHLELNNIDAAPVDNLETLKEHYGEDVHYTYTRLSRGLASNREAARLGFSACFSELLRALPFIDLSFVLATVERATTPFGNVKGQETRDYQFGRLFGLQAIVTSGILTRKETKKEQIRELVGMLFELSLSKGWLRESCASVIVEILDVFAQAAQTEEQGMSSKKLAKLSRKVAVMVHELLESSDMAKTMEGLAIHLQCADFGSTNPLPGTWKNENLLAQENLTAIAKIMLEQRDERNGENGDPDDNRATGTWKPKLHFAWIVLLKALIRAQGENSNAIKLEDFWRSVVDEGMFSHNTSHERKFHGLQLLSAALALVDEGSVNFLLTQNLLRTLINQISQEDRYLHKAAKNTAQQMVAICEAQRGKAIHVLFHLMNKPNGTLMFDRLSRTKTCEQIMLVVKPWELSLLVEELLEQFYVKAFEGESDTKVIERTRQYVADLLIMLLKSPKTWKDNDWPLFVLGLFIEGGLFYTDMPTRVLNLSFQPALSNASQDMLKARISTALGHLLPGKPNMTGPAKELFAVTAIRQVSELVANKHYTLRLAPDEQIYNLLQTAQTHLDEIYTAYQKSKTPRREAQGLAFSLLYSLSILQVYLGEPDAVELLEDLETAYAAFKIDPAAGQSKTNSDAVAMQTLVDLLLALLSKESALLRSVVETAFSAFAGQMQQEDLQLLLNVLEAQETGEGLFDKDQEPEDSEDDEEDDDDDNDDEDMVENDDGIEDESADESDSEQDSEGGNEQTEADRELDAALIAALGPAAQQKRKAEELEDEDSSDEELMDDEAMLKMDAHLENIFKRRKGATNAQAAKRQDEKQAKQSTIQLKSKVLDLLEIFIRENCNGSLVLSCLLPILSAAKSTSDAALADKARNLVKQKLTKPKVLPKLDPTGVAETWLTLKEVHRLASSAPSPPYASMASQSSIFLAKVLLNSSPENSNAIMRKLIDQYATSQAQWMAKKRSAYSASFFTDFINWSAQYRQK